jgi:hypothetical protein
MNYLNQYYERDIRLMEALSPAGRESLEVPKQLVDAATYYKVIRSFKKEGEKGGRLHPAWMALRSSTRPESGEIEHVVDCVCKLKDRLKTAYKFDALSASSKLLWLRYRSPIIIFDSRASRHLQYLDEPRSNSYQDYCQSWRNHFDSCQRAIARACRDLPPLKHFTAADDISNTALKAIVKETWFHERVFDNYLWTKGAKPSEDE